jgi:hypothetical protein
LYRLRRSARRCPDILLPAAAKTLRKVERSGLET